MIDARELFRKRRIEAILSSTARTDVNDLFNWQNITDDKKVAKEAQRAIDSLPKTLDVLKQREKEMESLLREMIEQKESQAMIDGLSAPLLFLSGMIRQMEKRRGLLTEPDRENKTDETKQNR